MKKALVLLSGGLDSTTALYVAQEQGFDELYAITFEYGQKHDKEIKAAKAVAKAAGVKEHKFVKIMLNQWDGCSLTDEKMDIHDGDINRTLFIRGTSFCKEGIFSHQNTGHQIGIRLADTDTRVTQCYVSSQQVIQHFVA